MSRSVEGHCVDPKFIPQGWALAAPLLAPAMKRGGLGSFAELERGVLYGNSLLWLAIEEGAGAVIAAVVTDLVITEADKVCLICACGGVRLRSWLHLLALIEGFARREGCTAVRLAGRKGWARVLPHYSQNHVILERKL
jgi:hypothetical protein